MIGQSQDWMKPRW